jgi:cytochrome c oxidase assembly protein subunit 15
MRWLGVAALGAVVAQGVLGGLTVLFFLPAPISTAHAGLAEIFFCMTVAIALFTSPGWLNGGEQVDDARLRRLATAATAIIYTQILVGATMRHTDAGLAIPDFPWMFGHVIPDHWDAKIAVHFAHRVGALLVAAAILATAARILSAHRNRRSLARPAMLSLVLVATQITLGALTVLSQRDVWINSVHLVCGALVLATSIVITLRSWRVKFAEQPAPRLQTEPAGESRLPPARAGALAGLAGSRSVLEANAGGKRDPAAALRLETDSRRSSGARA